MAPKSSPMDVPRMGPHIRHLGQGDQIISAGPGNVISAKDSATIYANSYSFGVGSHLEWLQATDPMCDKSRIQEQKGYDMTKNQGWCKWIFSNNTFNTWRHDKDSKLLWIHGNAGFGKTMLLAGIIDELDTRDEGAPKASTVSYYFCEAPTNTFKIQDATAVFRGLIAVLFERDPALALRPDYQTSPTESYQYKHPNAVYALSNRLKDMLVTLKHTVYLIIDAYDEYERIDEWEKILIKIGTSFECSNVHWLISSQSKCEKMREWYNKWSKKATGMFEIDLLSPGLSSAVEPYIDEELANITCLDGNPGLHQRLKQMIHKKAKSRFFWVSYICERLRDVESWDALEKEVENAPEDLGDTLPSPKSVKLIKERYAQADAYAKTGYEKYYVFKEKLRKISSGEINKGSREKEGSTYDLLTGSITAHRRAIEKAKEAHPHYHSAIIRADIGAAESYRELSHSRTYSREKQLKYIDLAEEHIMSAITRSREFGYTSREQRAKYEKVLLETRRVIIREKIGLYVGNKELHTVLLGRAFECRKKLERALDRSINDAKTIMWTQWWLGTLNKTVERLECES